MVEYLKLGIPKILSFFLKIKILPIYLFTTLLSKSDVLKTLGFTIFYFSCYLILNSQLYHPLPCSYPFLSIQTAVSCATFDCGITLLNKHGPWNLTILTLSLISLFICDSRQI